MVIFYNSTPMIDIAESVLVVSFLAAKQPTKQRLCRLPFIMYENTSFVFGIRRA